MYGSKQSGENGCLNILKKKKKMPEQNSRLRERDSNQLVLYSYYPGVRSKCYSAASGLSSRLRATNL